MAVTPDSSSNRPEKDNELTELSDNKSRDNNNLEDISSPEDNSKTIPPSDSSANRSEEDDRIAQLTDSSTHRSDKETQSESQENALFEAFLSVRGGSEALAQNFNAFFTYVGREVSRKQEQSYIDPFRLLIDDLESFDQAIRQILVDFQVSSDVVFDCDIVLKNRRSVSFQSLEEIRNMAVVDPSSPETVTVNWTYFITINWRQFSIPVPYKITLCYSVNARKEIIGAMTFASAPEQFIFLNIQGPQRLIQAINNDLDALIKSTFLPPWWLYPKKVLQIMEPYLGFAVYGAAISTVFTTFNNYEEWTGKSLYGGKTDEQIINEILADREKYLADLEELNEEKYQTLEEILDSPSIEAKFDRYAEYRLEEDKPRDFTPIDELFPDYSIVPTIGIMFLAFLIAGLLHILLLQLYKRLTPPSVIAIGKLGQRRMRLHKLYDWVAVTLIAAFLVPVLTNIAIAIFNFFRT